MCSISNELVYTVPQKCPLASILLAMELLWLWLQERKGFSTEVTGWSRLRHFTLSRSGIFLLHDFPMLFNVNLESRWITPKDYLIHLSVLTITNQFPTRDAHAEHEHKSTCSSPQVLYDIQTYLASDPGGSIYFSVPD